MADLPYSAIRPSFHWLLVPRPQSACVMCAEISERYARLPKALRSTEQRRFDSSAVTRPNKKRRSHLIDEHLERRKSGFDELLPGKRLVFARIAGLLGRVAWFFSFSPDCGPTFAAAIQLAL
jgi:hypothetical protein